MKENRRHDQSSESIAVTWTGYVIDLNRGSVIDFGQSAEEPVEVMVNGRVVARGEAVMVQGNYGVRISQIESRPDRLAVAPVPEGEK